ncbi:MAG TPA: DUF1153 domain-containing protein [Sphingomonadaceae bacterium]|nr:DUF1153 domain-containing protein [Sphingomonadaceae bacterium]
MSIIALKNNDIRKISSELPTTYSTRWSASKKAAVVRAVQSGMLSLSRALSLYRLSRFEYDSWQKSYAAGGKSRLLMKELQHAR